jgi:DNA primase
MSQETEQIKERLDLAEIIGEYVQLKQAGHHFKGLCPFHSEKTPSFVVSRDKGIWHCFGCNANGDVFSFIQQIEGLDFPAALKMLAERAGVQLQATAPARHDPRARQFELHALAARFYHELLINQGVGKRAKEYVAERGVQEETMKTFSIGYSPQRWDSLQLFLQQKGFSDREMMESGLVGRSQRGSLYDRFRGRIMFPIQDIQGRVVGFGGRITPWHATGEEGKYINSPETSIYVKRRVVYNLQRAKRSLHNQPCLVVEGYMDVVMLVQAGVPNVVASSGTAFTAEQVALLQRYTNTLHFAFDADVAGIQAAEAATKEAGRAGLRVATILFPSGKDPADVAKDNVEELKTYLAAPTSLVTVLLQRLQETEAGADRENMLARIMPLVQQTTNMVQQGEMIQDIAETLHVSEVAVMARLQNSVAPAAVPAPAASASDAMGIGLSRDQLLLGLIMLEPAVREQAVALTEEDFFATEQSTALWREIVARRSDVGFAEWSPDDVIRHLPEHLWPLAEAIRRVTEEHVAHLSTTPVAEAKALLRSLTTEKLSRKLRALQDQLVRVSGDERASALQEFQTTLKQLSSVSP